MPLYVPDDSAYMSYILPDFLKIVDKDTRLGDSKVAGGGIQITYSSDMGVGAGFARIQFSAIVTSDLKIYLKYVESSYTLPEDPDPSTGHVPRIAETQGATYAPGTGNANPEDSGVILVYLDAYNDNGANYWVRGVDGSMIFSPRWVQLFHELSHALHISRGQVNKDTPDSVEDALTIGDENKLRAQYHARYPWLKQRALTEEGGTGITDPDPSVNNPTPHSNCFIATAAYGSREAPQVARFRRIREDVLRRTALGEAFFSAFASEYYRFSPRIAAEMNRSAEFKLSILNTTVEPFLSFIEILEMYIDEGKRQGGPPCSAFLDTVLQRLITFSRRLSDEPCSTAPVAQSVYHEILALRKAVGRQFGVAQPKEVVQIAARPEDAVKRLAASIAKYEAEFPIVDWALMRPIEIYWWAITRIERGREDGRQVVRAMLYQVEQWLCATPVPPIFATLERNAVRESLLQLAETVFVFESVRREISRRISESFAAECAYDLSETFFVAGY